MSLSGLATTLWGILKTGHSGIMEGELTGEERPGIETRYFNDFF